MKMQVHVKETSEEEETRKEEEKTKEKDKQKRRHGGCLSWMSKRQREKHKPRNKFFLPNLKGC